MRKKLLISLLTLTFLIAFRGQVYRLLVHYEFKSERVNSSSCVLNKSLNLSDDASLLAIAKKTQQVTSKKLSFSASNPSSNAAEILEEGYGNCVGYARVVTQLIRCHDPEVSRFGVRQVAATIHFCGVSVHQFFDSAFFKDHDIVIVSDLENGEQIAIDPSLYDYSGISSIRFK